VGKGDFKSFKVANAEGDMYANAFMEISKVEGLPVNAIVSCIKNAVIMKPKVLSYEELKASDNFIAWAERQMQEGKPSLDWLNIPDDIKDEGARIQDDIAKWSLKLEDKTLIPITFSNDFVPTTRTIEIEGKPFDWIVFLINTGVL